MSRRAVVGAAIVDDLRSPGMLLAAQRSDGSSLAGGWELPGGKVEPGEQPIEALHREVREELSVAVRLGETVPGPMTDEAWPLGTSFAMWVWWAEIVDGTPLLGAEHQDLRWLPLPRLYDVEWLPDDRPIVEVLARSLQPPR